MKRTTDTETTAMRCFLKKAISAWSHDQIAGFPLGQLYQKAAIILNRDLRLMVNMVGQHDYWQWVTPPMISEIVSIDPRAASRFRSHLGCCCLWG